MITKPFYNHVNTAENMYGKQWKVIPNVYTVLHTNGVKLTSFLLSTMLKK